MKLGRWPHKPRLGLVYVDQVYKGPSCLDCHKTDKKNVPWSQWNPNKYSKLELSQTIWTYDFSTYFYLRRLYFSSHRTRINFFSNYNGKNIHHIGFRNYSKKGKRKLISSDFLLPRDTHCGDFEMLFALACVLCGKRVRDRDTERLRFVFFSLL